MAYSCYLCGKGNPREIRNKLRHSISRKVLRCASCGLVFLEPKKKALSVFYNRDYRKLYTPVINKSCTSAQIFNIYLPYQAARIARFKGLFNKNSRVLEIGCSTGHFLYALKNYVKECVGIDLNAKNATFARKKCGAKIYSRPLEETGLPKGYFDLIFLFETLEHLEDPLSMLRVVRQYLKPSGHLCIQVPNIDDVLLSAYKIKGYANFYFREPHLFYFSPTTIKKLADKAGYKGKVSMSQEYNLINHINWKINGSPMQSVSEGAGKPVLITGSGVNKKIKNWLNHWFAKIDEEYRKMLIKYRIAQSIIFIGEKAKA